jgi:hypothetical protein
MKYHLCFLCQISARMSKIFAVTLQEVLIEFIENKLNLLSLYLTVHLNKILKYLISSDPFPDYKDI